MRHTIISSIFLIAVAVLFTACGAATATKTTKLTAIKVDEATLDSAADFWANAPKLEVATKAVREGEPDGPVVTLQAAYDAENLLIRAEWADPTESIVKAAWQWDGSAFKTMKGNEDRVMFLWPMGNDAQFASKGCAAACHNQDPDEKKWWMGSESDDVRYDLWHWQSVRTNPVGQADDEWLGTRPDEKSKARKGDAKESGGSKLNQNEDKTGPAFMNGSDLTSSAILAGQETEIDSAAFEPGAIVPGYILSPFVGSRGDLSAQGRYADGKWVVVIKRALNTGYDDDLTFTPPKPIPFGVSVIDDGADNDHTTGPDVLTLEWK